MKGTAVGTTAYGLNLGTTNTVVAMAKDNGFEVLTIRPTVPSLIICPECFRDFQIGQNAIYERVARQILVDAG
ncbi:uncharacterized protein METZ01_LOCUS471048 [marine metagenome]|uniref:Uncharacterized protein n=1 Tax=marine metagenome TaxID=408172 RepID=A0A383BEA7_9ZZZZ